MLNAIGDRLLYGFVNTIFDIRIHIFNILIHIQFKLNFIRFEKIVEDLVKGLQQFFRRSLFSQKHHRLPEIDDALLGKLLRLVNGQFCLIFLHIHDCTGIFKIHI
ncbi:hypothetical protein D3C75_1231370 [compost metagenome]